MPATPTTVDTGSFRSAVDAAPFGRAQTIIVALAIVALISDGYDTQAMGNVAPVLIRGGVIDRAFMGYVFSAGTLGLTIGTILFGQIADHVGTKRVILACTCAYAVCTLMLAFVTSTLAFLVLRLIAGLGLGGVMPSAISLVSGYAPSRLRVRLVALVVAGFAFGGSLGGFLSAALIPHFGWPSVFLLGGLFPLLVLVPLLALAMPDAIPFLQLKGDREKILRATRSIVPDWTPRPQDVGPTSRVAKPTVGQLFAPGYKRPTTLFWLCYFANLLLLYFLAVWLPTMINFSGLSVELANVTTGLYQLSGIFGSFLLGWLADRVRPQRVLFGTFIVSACALFVISLTAHETPLLIVGIFAAGFCVIGGQGALNGFVSTFYPAAVRTTAQGWAVGIGRIGSILGPLIGGFLIAGNYTPPQVFRLCILASIAAAVFVIAIVRPGRAEPSVVRDDYVKSTP